MSTKTLKIPESLYRSASVRMDEAKELRMSISSDVPYKRYDWMADEEYYEVLDHGPGGCDDARLKAGLPILFNHDRDQHLARATKFQNDGKKIEVSDLVWSASDFAQAKKKDAESGALPDTSVGYRVIGDGECIGAKDGIPIYKFKWEIHEGSLVTIPADISVGVGRQRAKDDSTKFIEISVTQKKAVDETNNLTETRNQPPTMPNETAPATESKPTINVVEERKGAVAEFKARCTKIDEFVSGIKNPQWREAATAIAAKHKSGDADFEPFRTEALNSFDNVVTFTPSPEIGMSKKEKDSFSILRALRTMGNGRNLDGLEKEVSEAAAKTFHKAANPSALYIPFDMASHDLRDHPQFNEREFRAQNVGTSSAGGFTVATMLGSLIEMLRNKTVLGQAGITQLNGLQGDIAFPVQTGGATAAWVAETGALSDSQATFAQKTMTPNRLGATIPFTTQVLAQSSLSMEQFVRSELMTVTGIALDLAGLEGTGAAGQPLGVKNTSGIGADVTFGGAATWADVVLFETSVNADNADIGSMSFILSNSTVGKWKTILKDSVAGADYLINSTNGTANGYAVHRTNQVTDNIAFFGVWSQLLMGSWGTQEIIVDPYALKKSGQVEVTINSFHDFLVRQPLAFNVSTDSAAQ